MFADQLKTILKLKKVSQKQLADLFDVSQAAISNKFARNSWSAEEALRIFEYLGCHVIICLDEKVLFHLESSADFH